MWLPVGKTMQGSVRDYEGSRVLSVLTEKYELALVE